MRSGIAVLGDDCAIASAIGEMLIPTKRVSIRSAVIVLPAVVAIVCAWIASHRHNEQVNAIENYRSALRSGHDAAPNSLVAAYGVDVARDLMVRYSSESSDIVFDGTDRWVQILHVPNASQRDGGDGYKLYAVGDTIRHGWTLPYGARLQSVNFDDDEVVFYVHGNISQGSYMYNIPEDKPTEYRIKWLPGSLPPAIGVSDLMSQQYCVEANLAN